MSKNINSFLLALVFFLFPIFFSQAQVAEFISGEVGQNNSANRDIAESFADEWRDLVIDAGGCDTAFVSGDFEGLTPTPYPGSSVSNNNTVQLTVGGVPLTISNRDMNNIFGPTFSDLIGDPGGVVSLGNGSSLQDNSPRPASLFNTSNQPDSLSELSGSGSSRNAFLIEFAVPLQAFGAWFGDLETNSLGTDAFIRLFDASNNQIGVDTIVPADNSFLASNGYTNADCGAAPSGLDVTGCGNSTTRFIGFVSDSANLVKSMLVVVGDDDQPPSTFEGLTEHISLIGPSLNTDFSCTDVNLAVIKRDLRDPVEQGENLVFEILVTNFGTLTANSVILEDNLPPEYTFISAAADNGGFCSELAGLVECDLGAVANGEIVTVTIEVLPNALGTFSNEACVSSAENDTFEDDNCSQQSSTSAQTDFVNLTVFKNDLKDPVEPGENVFFELTVLNMGGLTATGVQLLDVLPPEYTFISASADNGGICSFTAGDILCDLGAILNGEIVTVSVEVSSSEEGIFTNSVCVSSGEEDFDDSNNCAQETTMIMPFLETEVIEPPEVPDLPENAPGLTTVLWNGFCDQQNFVSLGNICDETVLIGLELFGSDGSLLSTDFIALAPDQQIDYSINDMDGFSETDNGTLNLLASPGGCIEGDMGLFAPIGNGQMFSASILETSFGGSENLFLFANGEELNACYASFNTFQPSLNPLDAGLATIHWLQLANLSLEDKQSFTVNRYDSLGELISSEDISLNPGGRLDIAAGHMDEITSRYGLLEIVPSNQGADYLAQLFRYGLDSTVLNGERMSSFNLADNCSVGFSETSYLTVSRGVGAVNWIELSNLNNLPQEVLVDVYSNSGKLVESLEFNLEGKQTIHFNASEGLEEGESGIAKIEPVNSGRVLAKTTSYIYREDGRILTSETSESRTPLGINASGSFNSFRNQLNWLRLFNISEESQTITIVGFNQAGDLEIGSETISLSSKTGQDINLNALFSLSSTQIGRVKLTIENEQSILADIIRVQNNGAFTELQDIEVFEVR